MASIEANLDSPRAKLDGVNITVLDLDSNDDGAYDPDTYPTSPAIVYRIRARLAGEDDLLSQRFSPNGGTHTWPAVVFPAAGSWEVTVRDTDDDSEIASTTVVAS